MDTPLGLHYTPILPSYASVLAQVQQYAQYSRKMAYEQNKTVAQRRFDTAKELYKTTGNPTQAVYGPYFQKASEELIRMAPLVASGEIPAAEAFQYRNDIERKLNHLTNQQKLYDAGIEEDKKSGEMNIEHERSIFDSSMIDIVNGDGSLNHVVNPLHIDAERSLKEGRNDIRSYSLPVMSQNFIDKISKMESEERISAEASGIPGTYIQVTKGSLGRFLGPNNPNGKASIAVLGPNGEETQNTNDLVSAWKARGERSAKALELVKEGYETQEGKALTDGQALSMILKENGYVPQQIKKDIKNTPDLSNRFNSAWIGGTEKTHATYMELADKYRRLIHGTQDEKEEVATGFVSPATEPDAVSIKPPDSKYPNGYLSIQLNDRTRANPQMILLASLIKDENGKAIMSKDDLAKKDIFNIPLTDRYVSQLAIFDNLSKPGKADVDPDLVIKAYKQLSGTKATEAVKDKTQITQAEFDALPLEEQMKFRRPEEDKIDKAKKKLDSAVQSLNPKSRFQPRSLVK